MTTQTASMPRSALRHRPIAPDVQEWTIEETRVNRRKQQHEPHTIGGMPGVCPQLEQRVGIGK